MLMHVGAGSQVLGTGPGVRITGNKIAELRGEEPNTENKGSILFAAQSNEDINISLELQAVGPRLFPGS